MPGGGAQHTTVRHVRETTESKHREGRGQEEKESRMAAADGKSDNGRCGAPSLEKKENLKPRFSGPNPRSKTTFWMKSKEHDNNNKQNIKIKSIGSIDYRGVLGIGVPEREEAKW